MPASTRFVLVVSMDVAADKEDLFNEVYDNEHVPFLLQVPGVVSVQRFQSAPFQLALGGELVTLGDKGAPRYSACYEIESPQVLTSDAWAEACERGRWAEEVRPHTSNRHHELRELL